jgi:hypothetical protein
MPGTIAFPESTECLDSEIEVFEFVILAFSLSNTNFAVVIR